MSNDEKRITLSELIEKFKKCNTDFKNVSIDFNGVRVIAPMTAEEYFAQEQPQTPPNSVTKTTLLQTEDVIKVKYQKFKTMTGLGDKAIRANQVPGCTWEPVQNGEKYMHVYIDLSKEELLPYAESIRSQYKRNAYSRLFFNVTFVQNKYKISGSKARNRLVKQPCIYLINTKRPGRAIWPRQSVNNIGDTI